MQRIFIVGCPRSGTTLVQAMLGAHPAIFTLPETGFLQQLRPRSHKARAARLFGIVSPSASQAALRAVLRLARMDGYRLYRYQPRLPLRSHYLRAFRRILDDAAGRCGKPAWLEKSPHHLHYIEDITKVMPDARIVHIVRDGQDVVASFYDELVHDPPRWLKQVNPEVATWSPADSRNPLFRARLLHEIAQCWNRDVAVTRYYRHAPQHHIVIYEALAEHPERELRALSAFLRLPFDARMLEHAQHQPVTLTAYGNERATRNALQALQQTKRVKWDNLFTDADRATVAPALAYPNAARAMED